MKRRVVVTGIGCINSLGGDPVEMWQRLLRGQSGIGRITLFDASKFPTKIAAEVREPAFQNAPGGCGARQTRFAVAAAERAMENARLTDFSGDPTRLGVYLGCGDVHPDFGQFVQMVVGAMQAGQFELAEFIKSSLQKQNPAADSEMQPNMAASRIASLFNAQGPNISCFTACAASSQAIGEATEFIRSGAVDVMLAGGTHSLIHPFGVTGLNLLTALSTNNDDPTKASRPFDRDRDGFVLGEGAGMLVLEDFGHAAARGATIYGEIRGYGCAADAYRITDTHPEGRGAVTCMRQALNDARLNPDDIDYINAHGTSTFVNDKVETLAVKQVFGPQAYRTPISSTKSMTGHLLAAAGVTELIVCLMALGDGAVPPTINYDTPDQECDLDYVPNSARETACTNILSNSFGFGGQSVSLVVSRV